MVEVVKRYFKNIFFSGRVNNLEYILSGTEVCISDRMNQGLTKNYTRYEVILALKSMRPTKASRSDGFLALFFQKYWHTIGQEVGDFYLDILNDKVIYKIISKAVANQLQKTQSAFVLGRLIMDNVLLAYELMHSLKQRIMGQHGSFALKLDMNKAMIGWSGLFWKKIMHRMGFREPFVSIIMRCVTLMNYSVFMNGLSSLMRLTSWEGTIKGAKVCRKGPTITHLLFADDCILIGDATKRGAQNLKTIL
ncbi:reverse transcriptase [Gossypium australe]|uniref:Reverse transcriptase n=1 Tax=Gossypium australe TaxID=47621 RepID=A0A5B6WSZ8_9ROSI|nr:reverse transcriptase [Gossypium australe]